jgi:hypothetical protein
MGTNQMQAMAEVGLKNRELDIRKGQVIQEALAKQAELEAQARAESRKPPVLAEIPVARGEQTVQWYPDTQSFGPPTVVLPDGVVDEGVTPMDIPTVEGPFIPANEGVISEDGKTVNYLGKIYTIDPSVLPPIIPSPATDITNSIGFKPEKSDDWRDFTPEEVLKYGGPGQINKKNNQRKMDPRPTGTEVVTENGRTTVRYGAGVGGGGGPKVGEGQTVVEDATSPTGTRVVNIPGGKAELEAQQAINAKEAAKERGVELGTIALSEIDRFIDYTNRMSNLPGASALRPAMAKFGMQEQAEAQSSLDTVSANLKFEALDALRQSSPSGASGLGQVTQNEFSALADQWGTLRLQGDPEKIRERAISIKRKLLDIVHGSAKHREELLKKGVITSDQYNKIQSQYPGEQQATQEDANLQRYRDIFNTQQ